MTAITSQVPAVTSERAWRFVRENGVYLALAAVLLFNLLATPNFASLRNLQLQLVQVAPVVIVATLENKLPMLLVSRPEIKEPQQLRGKVIGINRFGGSNAQRDIVDLTLLEAARRANKHCLVRALSNERLALKPNNVLALRYRASAGSHLAA